MIAPKRDPANIGCGQPSACQLADSVANVKCGTPLRATTEGYVVAQPDDEPEFYAASHAESGSAVKVYRSMTIETYEKAYRPGDRLDIESIDDFGNLYFRVDPEGPYSTSSESAVYLDTTQWLLRKGIKLARERSRRDAESRPTADADVQNLREAPRDQQSPQESVLAKPAPQVIEGW